MCETATKQPDNVLYNNRDVELHLTLT